MIKKSKKSQLLFFFSKPVPFTGLGYEKQNESVTSDQSLFRLQNKFSKMPLLEVYCLTKFDDVI